MKLWEWSENEYFLITLSEEQVCNIIREYYQNEGFKGEIKFKKYIRSVPDGFGYTDDYGSMKIQFIDKIRILNEEQERIKEVSAYDIDFNSIFSPLLEDSEYEIAVSGVYKPYFNFKIVDSKNKVVDLKSLNLYITKKQPEKVLKRTKNS